MNGDYDKARDAYQRQIDLDLPGALITDSASTVLAKAANLDYESLMRLAAAYAQAGDCSSKQDDIPRAIREYEVSLTLDPTNMMTANNYAYFLALAGHELDKAEQLSRRLWTNNRQRHLHRHPRMDSVSERGIRGSPGCPAERDRQDFGR